MVTSRIKELLPHLLCLLIMLGVTTVYFFPQVEGKVMNRSDKVQSHKMRGEIHEFKEAGIISDNKTWNNSMFGGMPNGMLKLGREYNLLGHLDQAFKFFIADPIGIFFSSMLLCYLALFILGVSPWIALLGAILFGLNTNLLIIWETGHSAKNFTVAFFPLIVAGMFVVMKGRHVAGGLLFAAGISFSVYHVHPQMLYYLLLGLAVVFIVDAITRLLNKSWTLDHTKGMGVLVVALLIGVLSNFSQVQALLSHGSQTMRGEPILEQAAGEGSSSEEEGLNWDYAMGWSNGTKDVLGILIPGAAGGGNAEEVSKNSESGKLLIKVGQKARKDGTFQVPLYHGSLPSTSGPVYLGAITILLFVVALFYLETSVAIGLALGMLLIICMSMGRNMPTLNHFLFDYLPYFDKFRAPTSVFHGIAPFLIIPAMMGLSKFLEAPFSKRILYATGSLTGLCALLYLTYSFFMDFGHPSDAAYQKEIADIFKIDRELLFSSDALRTLLLVLLSSVLLYLFSSKKITFSPMVVVIGLIALSIFDLWGIGRRYLDSNNWLAKRQYDQLLAPRDVDLQIKKMEPKGRGYYRIHDLSINTFSSAESCMYHNSLGGYSAAKLQRIQDLNETYLLKGDQRILNMYNVKYVINPQRQVQVNSGALGNAWFVSDIKLASNAGEELKMLGNLDVANEAVILGAEFNVEKESSTDPADRGEISMIDYKPGFLKYSTNNTTEQWAVFSETWYPKFWQASINGNDVPIYRANYSLRALKVPKGENEIIFEFKPQPSYWLVSLICSFILLIGIGWMLWQWFNNYQASIAVADLDGAE